jgi:hypothetical protein
MDRRSIFKIMAAATAVVPLLARKSAAADEKKSHRLVLHVDQNDPAIMKLRSAMPATPMNYTRSTASRSRSKSSATARVFTCCATTPRR